MTEIEFKHTVYKILSHADDRIKKLSLRVNRSESHLVDGLVEDFDKLTHHVDHFLELLKQVQFSARFDPESTDNLHNTLKTILDALITTTHADRGFIMWADGDHHLTIGAHHDWEDQSPDHAVAEKIIKRALDEKKTVITNNFEFHGDGDGSAIPQSTFALRFIICTPMYTDFELMGVAYVDIQARAGQLPTDILHWIEAFSTQAAVAIHNAILFDKVNSAQ